MCVSGAVDGMPVRPVPNVLRNCSKSYYPQFLPASLCITALQGTPSEGKSCMVLPRRPPSRSRFAVSSDERSTFRTLHATQEIIPSRRKSLRGPARFPLCFQCLWRRLPSRASERKQRAQPGERPAAAPAAAKTLPAADSSRKCTFREGRPYSLGLISGYLGLEFPRLL